MGTKNMSKKLWVIGIIFLLVAIDGIIWKAVPKDFQKPFRIGAVLPMTGSAAGYGKWIQRGIDLAIEDINKSGGLRGRKFEVIIEDSKSDNRAGVDAANKLISIDKVPVIETTLTGVTKSIIPLTEKNQVILFTSATAPGLTDEGKYVFRNATNIKNEVDKMLWACKNKLNLYNKEIAIIYINNPVGIWINQYFKKKFEAGGGNVSASESFQPDSVDFRTQIEKIKQTKPEALYILGYQQNGLIMKQARELGLRCQFLGVTDMELPDALRIAGNAAEGVVYTKAEFDAKSSEKKIAAYAKRYKQRYGDDPEVYGATAYDATRIIVAAVGKVGLNADTLRGYILGLKNYPGISGLTTFLPNGDVVKPVVLKKIINGKLSLYGE